MHKFQHTIQIIRFLNRSRAHFSKDSYLSISGALAKFVIEQNKTRDSMKKFSAYTNVIKTLVKDKRTEKHLRTYDSREESLASNMKYVDQTSMSF